MELSKIEGPYSTFSTSPMAAGKLQYHLWDKTEEDLVMNDRYDWKGLVDNIKKYGVRNSLLTALMPTASTSQIMGNCESFEPHHTNLYIRETLSGEFIVINKYLIRDLIKLGLWTTKIRNKLNLENGSVQRIHEIPSKYREIYKTAFEIKMKDVIDQAADRGIYIDQSQSMNLFMDTSDKNKLNSAHIYAWKRGLKTLMYYLRSKPAKKAINFGIDIEEQRLLEAEMNEVEKIPEESGMCMRRKGIKISECSTCSS
jgi:ribonucleoside-diphosphate reductase alpha chain